MSTGAAHERTVLAWRRTLVSVTVVALLLARLVAADLPPGPAAAGLTAVALLWTAAVLLTRRRMSRVTTPIGRTLPAMALLILLYCAMGTLLLVS